MLVELEILVWAATRDLYNNYKLLLYCQESILAKVVFPSQNNNIVQCAFRVLQAMGIGNF